MTELFTKGPEVKYTRVYCPCKKNPDKRRAVILVPSIDPGFLVGECSLCKKRHAQKVEHGEVK